MSDVQKPQPRSSLVSYIEEDSLECIPPVLTPQSPQCTNSEDQPSLQELIEAELVARLQPDSLEPPLLADDHQHTVTLGSEELTANCSVSLDSLNQAPFSMDSLMECSKERQLSNSSDVVEEFQKQDLNDQDTEQLAMLIDFKNDSLDSETANDSTEVVSETEESDEHMQTQLKAEDSFKEEEINVTLDSDILNDSIDMPKSIDCPSSEPEASESSDADENINTTVDDFKIENLEYKTTETVQETKTITYTIETVTNESEDKETSDGEIPSFSAPVHGFSNVETHIYETESTVTSNGTDELSSSLFGVDVTNNCVSVTDELDMVELPNASINMQHASVDVAKSKKKKEPIIEEKKAEKEPEPEEASDPKENSDAKTPKEDEKRKKKKKKKDSKLSRNRTNSSSSGVATDSDFNDQDLIDEIPDSQLTKANENKSLINDTSNHVTGINLKQLKESYISVTETTTKKDSEVTEIGHCQSTIANLVDAYTRATPKEKPQSQPKDISTVTPLKNLVEVYTHATSTDSISSQPTDIKTVKPLKNLKSAYEACATRSSNSSSPKKEEVMTISLSELKNNYCSAAHLGDSNPSTSRSRSPNENSVAGRWSMTRSCGDLSVLEENQPSLSRFGDLNAFSNVSVKALTRSFSDLTRLADYVKNERSSLDSTLPPSTPHLEVSVRQLRNSYRHHPYALNRSAREPAKIELSPSNIEIEHDVSEELPNSKPLIKTGVSVLHMRAALQNKDALYEKHVGPRIRSFDTAKMKSKFNQPKDSSQMASECRICGKQVFQMEKIVAEKASWHKTCFKCSECDKQLTLESYQSHEGALYCKPHFKDLFRPKAVLMDEADELREKLRKGPQAIVFESQPQKLSDEVVRASDKPDYGLEDLQSLNVKERFSLFENASNEPAPPKLEHISVQRSQSMISRAARFLGGPDDRSGSDDDDEMDEYDEEYDEDDENSENDENKENGITVKKKRKGRPMSFSGIGDLKNAWEQKQRRENMSNARKEEIGKFRQMLCAGKNTSLKEMFESGKFENSDEDKIKEQINIETRRAAKSLKERFEKGQPFILEDEEDEENLNRKNNIGEEREEVKVLFKEAETAKKARDVFKNIDSVVAKEGTTVMRSKSFAQTPRDNRISQEISFLRLQTSPSTAEVIKSTEKVEDVQVDTGDLMNRFKFFSTYEKQQEEKRNKEKKVFRITPPREGVQQVELPVKAYMPKPCMAINCAVCKLRGLVTSDNVEVGRDPNLIKSTDNYEDDIDCTNTKNILQMFKKMEQGKEEEDTGPRPLKCFTPPPEARSAESGSESEEYTDEDYSSEEETEEDDHGKPKYKDEILEMSAKRAASLRAKFEKYENEIDEQNAYNGGLDGEDSGEEKPGLDTARNLKAMFEHKAMEVTKPVVKAAPVKVNRFVGGGGEKCEACGKTVYAMEKLEIANKILHKTCFKCTKCNTRLSVGSFSVGGDKMYCTTHYKQLFTEKGSYDAFSDTINWTRKIEASNGEIVKSHD